MNLIDWLKRAVNFDDLKIFKEVLDHLRIRYTVRLEESYKGVEDCWADGVVTIITVLDVEFIFNGFNKLEKVSKYEAD